MLLSELVVKDVSSYQVVCGVVCVQTMYPGVVQPQSVCRPGDVMTQQLVPDRGAEAGTRGKVKSEKDHYRVGPYPTPQQYMLNKRAKYAGSVAPLPAADVRTHAHSPHHIHTHTRTI